MVSPAQQDEQDLWLRHSVAYIYYKTFGINVGWHGEARDARVFANSSLFT